MPPGPRADGALARGRRGGRPSGRAPPRRDLRRAHVGPAVGGLPARRSIRSAAICAGTAAASSRPEGFSHARDLAELLERLDAAAHGARRRLVRRPRRLDLARLPARSWSSGSSSPARRSPTTSGRRRCRRSSSVRRSCSRPTTSTPPSELNLSFWLDRAPDPDPETRATSGRDAAPRLRAPAAVLGLHRGRAAGRATERASGRGRRAALIVTGEHDVADFRRSGPPGRRHPGRAPGDDRRRGAPAEPGAPGGVQRAAAGVPGGAGLAAKFGRPSLGTLFIPSPPSPAGEAGHRRFS